MLEFKSLAARAYPICNLDNLFYSWRMLIHPEPSLLTLLTLVRQVESKEIHVNIVDKYFSSCSLFYL